VFTASHRGGDGPPLVCLHGFTDTWRTWELVLPALEREHDVLAPTLAGHAGGPPVGELDAGTLADGVERAMDEAGFETAHIAGNSLGGHVALQLATRGRARSVVALAPAGGWEDGDESWRETLANFTTLIAQARASAPHADAIAASPDGRRAVLRDLVERGDDVPAGLVAHLVRGAAGCDGAAAMIELAHEVGWPLAADRIACPVRVVWGTADRILPWPSAAARYRRSLHADWVELDGVGHAPQLDAPLETAQLILGWT